MKKVISFVLIMCAYASFSQLSISLDNKFGFKMPGSYGGWGYGNYSSNGSSATYTSKKFCFGNGYQGGLNLRYGFKQGIGVDLGLAYLLGLRSETTSSSNSGSGYSSSGNDEIRARFFRINLGMSYVGTGKIAPVVKMGLSTAKGHIKYNYNYTSTSTQYSYNPNPPYNSYTVTTTSTTEQESKYYGGISLGFYSALGVNYKANDKVSLSLCFDVVVQDFSPKKAKLTKSTIDGVDQLPKMMKSEKEIEFVKSYTDVGAPPNNASAGQSNKISFPISSFGPSFSIIITLGSKKETSSTPSTTTENK